MSRNTHQQLENPASDRLAICARLFGDLRDGGRAHVVVLKVDANFLLEESHISPDIEGK